MTKRTLFDKRYYDHFYGRWRYRAAEKRADETLGDFVCAYLKYLNQPVRRVLDIGCGFGFWREVAARHFPKASYTGVEISEYLCEKLGWIHGSVVDFKSPRPFDLVICKDTLQYLAPKDAEAAITNLARLCRGALYVNVLTKDDWEENCDQERTDADIYMRRANWYRKLLGRRFTNVGGGVFLSARSPAIPWELEKLSG